MAKGFIVALLALGIIALAQSVLKPEDAPLVAAQVPVARWQRLLYSSKLKNVEQVTWAGHRFERAVLNTNQYKTSGNKAVTFTDSGWHAPSYSMPRSRMLDVNLNQKVRVKVTGTFEGESTSSNENCTGRCITTEKYHFSEFAIYVGDESGNRQGVMNLGTRDNVIRGNSRRTYTFTSLTVENTGNEIMLTDSNGFTLSYTPDFKYVTAHGTKEENRGGHYGTLNKNQKWFLGINCHVNTDGYCKLHITDIRVTK